MTHDYTHCKGVWGSKVGLADICTDCLRYALHREIETGKYKGRAYYFNHVPGMPGKCEYKITNNE